MPKVFITNFSGYPYEPAKKYGEELIFMTNGFLNLAEIDSIKNKVNEFITQVKPEDYLVLSGNNLIAAHVVVKWIQKIGYINILHWDNIKKEYIHFVLN